MLTGTRDPVSLAIQADEPYITGSAYDGNDEDGLEVEAASPLTSIMTKITPVNPSPVSNLPAVSVAISVRAAA